MGIPPQAENAVDVRKLLEALSTEPAGQSRDTGAVSDGDKYQPADKASETNAEGANTPVDESTFAVSVYILPTVLSAVRNDCDTSKEMNSTIALNAIDAAIERGWLQWLVQRRHVVPRSEGSVFPPRSASRRSRSKKVREPKRRQWQPFLTQAEFDIIDELRKKCGSERVSEIISVAVEAYYEPPSQDEQQSWRAAEDRAKGIHDLDAIGAASDPRSVTSRADPAARPS